MVQITTYFCNKCKKQFEIGSEKYLQLIDRQKMTMNHYGDNLVVQPTFLHEYTLCPECFKEFNESTSFPYKES